MSHSVIKLQDLSNLDKNLKILDGSVCNTLVVFRTYDKTLHFQILTNNVWSNKYQNEVLDKCKLEKITSNYKWVELNEYCCLIAESEEGTFYTIRFKLPRNKMNDKFNDQDHVNEKINYKNFLIVDYTNEPNLSSLDFRTTNFEFFQVIKEKFVLDSLFVKILNIEKEVQEENSEENEKEEKENFEENENNKEQENNQEQEENKEQKEEEKQKEQLKENKEQKEEEKNENDKNSRNNEKEEKENFEGNQNFEEKENNQEQEENKEQKEEEKKKEQEEENKEKTQKEENKEKEEKKCDQELRKNNQNNEGINFEKEQKQNFKVKENKKITLCISDPKRKNDCNVIFCLFQRIYGFFKIGINGFRYENKLIFKYKPNINLISPRFCYCYFSKNNLLEVYSIRNSKKVASIRFEKVCGLKNVLSICVCQRDANLIVICLDPETKKHFLVKIKLDLLFREYPELLTISKKLKETQKTITKTNKKIRFEFAKLIPNQIRARKVVFERSMGKPQNFLSHWFEFANDESVRGDLIKMIFSMKKVKITAFQKRNIRPKFVNHYNIDLITNQKINFLINTQNNNNDKNNENSINSTSNNINNKHSSSSNNNNNKLEKYSKIIKKNYNFIIQNDLIIIKENYNNEQKHFGNKIQLISIIPNKKSTKIIKLNNNDIPLLYSNQCMITLSQFSINFQIFRQDLNKVIENLLNSSPMNLFSKISNLNDWNNEKILLSIFTNALNNMKLEIISEILPKCKLNFLNQIIEKIINLISKNTNTIFKIIFYQELITLTLKRIITEMNFNTNKYLNELNNNISKYQKGEVNLIALMNQNNNKNYFFFDVNSNNYLQNLKKLQKIFLELRYWSSYYEKKQVKVLKKFTRIHKNSFFFKKMKLNINSQKQRKKKSKNNYQKKAKTQNHSKSKEKNQKKSKEQNQKKSNAQNQQRTTNNSIGNSQIRIKLNDEIDFKIFKIERKNDFLKFIETLLLNGEISHLICSIEKTSKNLFKLNNENTITSISGYRLVLKLSYRICYNLIKLNKKNEAKQIFFNIGKISNNETKNLLFNTLDSELRKYIFKKLIEKDSLNLIEKKVLKIGKYFENNSLTDINNKYKNKHQLEYQQWDIGEWDVNNIKKIHFKFKDLFENLKNDDLWLYFFNKINQNDKAINKLPIRLFWFNNISKETLFNVFLERKGIDFITNFKINEELLINNPIEYWVFLLKYSINHNNLDLLSKFAKEIPLKIFTNNKFQILFKNQLKNIINNNLRNLLENNLLKNEKYILKNDDNDTKLLNNINFDSTFNLMFKILNNIPIKEVNILKSTHYNLALLIQNEKFDYAYFYANEYSIPIHAITLSYVTSLIYKHRKNSIFELVEERIVLWNSCDSIFKKKSILSELAGEFFLFQIQQFKKLLSIKEYILLLDFAYDWFKKSNKFENFIKDLKIKIMLLNAILENNFNFFPKWIKKSIPRVPLKFLSLQNSLIKIQNKQFVFDNHNDYGSGGVDDIKNRNNAKYNNINKNKELNSNDDIIMNQKNETDLYSLFNFKNFQIIKKRDLKNNFFQKNCNFEELDQLLGSLINNGKIKKVRKICAQLNYENIDLIIVNCCLSLVKELNVKSTIILKRESTPKYDLFATLKKKLIIFSFEDMTINGLIEELILLSKYCSQFCKKILINFEISQKLKKNYLAIEKIDYKEILIVLLKGGLENFQLIQNYIYLNKLNSSQIAIILSKEFFRALIAEFSLLNKKKSINQNLNINKKGKSSNTPNLNKLLNPNSIKNKKTIDVIGSFWSFSGSLSKYFDGDVNGIDTNWNKLEFSRYVNLSNDQKTFGYSLYKIAMKNLDLIEYVIEVELFVRAYLCFSMCCCISGIRRILAILKKRVPVYIQNGKINLIPWILRGVNEYEELEYLFELLHENNQFELILSKNLNKDSQSELQFAISKYLKNKMSQNKIKNKDQENGNENFNDINFDIGQNNNDNQRLLMVYLRFNMFYQIGDYYRNLAHKQLKSLEITLNKKKSHGQGQGQGQGNTHRNKLTERINIQNNQLLMIGQMFIDSADAFLKDNSNHPANKCISLANLTFLQIRFDHLKVINLSKSKAINLLTTNFLSYIDCQVITKAYQIDRTLIWAKIIYCQIMEFSNLSFISNYIMQNSLNPDLIFELINLFKKDPLSEKRKHKMETIIGYTENRKLQYQIAKQLGLNDLKKNLEKLIIGIKKI
ncbi:hypothetical protein M0813_10856 [Anaeramoeba flamelloides]|uniref:Spatacsin C-terminal domain-containing protein n=1 Tax=Anaeramoeba flamelloides TaxID=1746091 RepID=A0ABQ8X341_9EUKA|nr:hypothetical protein M0813_10856 [Anaeramoeba flamelloides]